jgi:thiol-disulfide isomerase/thioredoxin
MSFQKNLATIKQALKPRVLFCWACIITTILAVLMIFSVPAQAKELGLPDLPHELKQKNFVLVEFYTEWCSVCQEMAPYIESLKDESCKDLQIVQLDTDKKVNSKYAARYQIEGVPTFILFDKAGKAVYKMDEIISPRILRKNILKSMNRPLNGSIASTSCKP